MQLMTGDGDAENRIWEKKLKRGTNERVLDVCRKSNTACSSHRWEDSWHDLHCRRCKSSSGAAKWRAEATERVH